MLLQTMQRYLSEVKVSHLTADKRDPEFGFYDQTKGVMTAYRYVQYCVFKIGYPRDQPNSLCVQCETRRF